MIGAAESNSRMKTFDNEWIFEVFRDHPSFFTKRMFGGLAAVLLWLVVVVKALQGDKWKIPGLGEFAESYAASS